MTALHRIFALTSLVALSFAAAAVSGVTEQDARIAPNECPVRASLAVVPGEKQHAAQLTLTLQIAEPWYIYVKSSRSSVLEIDLQLPTGVMAEGEWVRPKPRVVYQDERVEVYAGDQTLRRNLRVDASAPATGKVTATIRFQACDPTVCRPPEEISVAVDLSKRASR